MAAKLIDMTGQRIGRLLVLHFDRGGPTNEAHWLCVCDCSNELSVRGSSLRRGAIQSCGCLKRDNIVAIGKNNRTHGGTGSPTYGSWQSMRHRCLCKNDTKYKYYGGKGITVCERWATSYEAFLEDMGERPIGTTLDRFPNKDGNYEPGNCRWATTEQQNRNKSNNHRLTLNGKTMTISEWSNYTGIHFETIRHRILHGWPINEVLTFKD